MQLKILIIDLAPTILALIHEKARTWQAQMGTIMAQAQIESIQELVVMIMSMGPMVLEKGLMARVLAMTLEGIRMMARGLEKAPD